MVGLFQAVGNAIDAGLPAASSFSPAGVPLTPIAPMVSLPDLIGTPPRTSLSAAARTLAMSLPVISRGLAELERGLGVRLFTRTTRSLALTDEGETYRQHCLRLLTDIDEAESALAQIRATPMGRVTVSAPLLFGRRCCRVSGALPRRVGRPATCRPRGQSDRQ